MENIRSVRESKYHRSKTTENCEMNLTSHRSSDFPDRATGIPVLYENVDWEKRILYLKKMQQGATPYKFVDILTTNIYR